MPSGAPARKEYRPRGVADVPRWILSNDERVFEGNHTPAIGSPSATFLPRGGARRLLRSRSEEPDLFAPFLDFLRVKLRLSHRFGDGYTPLQVQRHHIAPEHRG